ncbi:MAG TPA: hypothetical protein PLQ89_08850, partial [Phycisphaerae bacterium]|nr:hypothetical protein [Phycisphaerae bacterium]
PSLRRARDTSRFIVCQTNVKHLMAAFISYSVDNKGRFPGNRGDEYADWLGGYNGHPSERKYGRDGNRGKQPEWGTIFKKHMGGMTAAYSCPDDKTYRERKEKGWSSHSYTANLMISGAKPESLMGAHYPKPMTSTNPQYNRTNHVNMAAMEHVPVIIEEHETWYLLHQVDDSGWCNEDSISERHLREPGKFGQGSIGYADGHAGGLRVPFRTEAQSVRSSTTLTASDFCIRTGRKWVNGESWDDPTLMNPNGGDGVYGILDKAPDAGKYGITH